jgi:hypothetical protein
VTGEGSQGTTFGRARNAALAGLSIVWLLVACGSGDTKPESGWNCLLAIDGCTCAQLRPGQLPRPGVEYIDSCPAAQCCLLSSQADGPAVAICECITVADDCEDRAMKSVQTKVVAKCPPP